MIGGRDAQIGEQGIDDEIHGMSMLDGCVLSVSPE
jgi:hypothetical protein